MIRKISLVTLINFLSQVVSITGFALISRLYGPESLGGLFVFLSYSSIVSVISSGYLEQSFFILKQQNLFKHVLILIFYLTTFISLISGLIFFFIGVSYIMFIICNVFSESILKTISSLNISTNRILFISISKFLFSPIIPLCYYLSFQTYGNDEFYLIFISSVLNILFASIITVITLRKLNISMFVRDFFRFKILILLFRRFFKFTKFSMTGELMRTIAFKGPTIVLERFFGKDIAGFYGIANRILLLPTMVFMGSVTQIYIEKVSNSIKKQLGILTFTKSILKILSITSLIGFTLFIVFGKNLIVILIGDDFKQVYFMIILLLPYAISLVTLSPLLSIFTVFEKQEKLFKLKFLVLISSIFSFTISVIFNNFNLGLIIFSVTTCIIYSSFSYMSLKVIKSYDKKNS